jgi:hypothetical protein
MWLDWELHVSSTVLITTDDLFYTDRVPPDRFIIVCQHGTNDLQDAVSSQLPRPPPSTLGSEPPLPSFLPAPRNTRRRKRPLDDNNVSKQGTQLTI